MSRFAMVVVLAAACDPGPGATPEARALEGTNVSVKELVACGGMQYSAMRGLAGAVVSEAGYPDIARMLFGEVDLTRDGADYITLLPGGVFTMRFDAGEGHVDADVFKFSSYVADPILDTPASLDAWYAGDVDFALHFSGPGPLFDVLDAGRGLRSPIRFRIFSDDVWQLALYNRLQGDLRDVFGPLFDGLQIDSGLDFQDARDGVVIAYRMATPPSSILGLLDDGSLTMLIEELEARYDGFIVRPIDVDVRYVEDGRRGLAGSIEYGVFDSEEAVVPVCTAVADYGDGAVYGDLARCAYQGGGSQ